MSITKADLASRIHKALGVNTRFTEATPEQVSDTLDTVNDWMLSQNGLGVRLGWIEVTGGAPDPNEDTGIPSWANQGVVYSCAQLVAAYFDKQITQIILSAATQGMQTILSRTVEYQEVYRPDRAPRGTGNRTTYSNKYYRHCDRIQTSNDFLTDEGDDPITSCGVE